MSENLDKQNEIINESMLPVVEIFWTGGYDSTFRIVQLSRCAVCIQPYYISDDRCSEANELAAIEYITEQIKEHRDTKCIFLDMKIVKSSERIEIQQVSDAYNELRKKEFFGNQYEWLACFATQHKGIELSIHKDDKAIALINKYASLKKVEDEIIGDYFVIDEAKSNPYITTLFGDYHLPLVEMTKLDMKKYYTDNLYDLIMNSTWFCHKPVKGEACGVCNPCMYTIEEGLKERFSATALRRYHLRKLTEKIGLWKYVNALRTRFLKS